MATATSSHYIRTIHTSFTAAHSNPWARTTSSAAAMPQLYHQNQKYSTPASNPPSNPTTPATAGRRRAYAFRVAPPPPSRPASTGPSYKFDPFADEPTTPVPSIAHLASLSTPPTPRLAAASLPPSQHSYQLQQQRAYHQQQAQAFHSPPPVRRQFNQRRVTSYNQVNQGYAAPPQQRRAQHQQQQPQHHFDQDIWRHTASGNNGAYTPIPRGRTLTYEFEEYTDFTPAQGIERIAPPRIQRAAPLPSPTPTPVILRTPTPAPKPAPVATARTPSPPAPKPFVADKDAKAKLVAGILLNRALHAAGRRGRRVPSPVGGKKPYVPSGLSRVVSVDA